LALLLLSVQREDLRSLPSSGRYLFDCASPFLTSTLHSRCPSDLEILEATCWNQCRWEAWNDV
jgi:hypothetical protein